MSVKQFLVQFEADERTRWLVDDVVLASELGEVADGLARRLSDGSLPRVSVVREQAAEDKGKRTEIRSQGVLP